MESHLKKRRSVRTILSKYCKTVETALNAEIPASLITLERHSEELSKKIDSVTETHNTLTLLAEEAELDSVVTEQINWLENRMEILDILNTRIAELKNQSHNLNEPDARSFTADNASRGDDSLDTLGLRSGIKLAKLDLATFDGVDIDAFADFKDDHYTNVYCNKALTPATKMSYLRRTCKGDALQMISGFTLSAESYETAWNLLCRRYGRPERVAMRHISALLRLEQPKQARGQAYVNSIYKLYTEVNLHVRSLENLITTLKAEDILVPLIVSKFPASFLHEFSKTFKDKDTKLQDVLMFLESECQRYEFVCDISQNMGENYTKEKSQNFTNPTRGSAVALQVQTDDTSETSLNAGKQRVSCAYCKDTHASRLCSKFWKSSIGDRRELVLQAKLCFRCLNSGHMARDCSKVCKICGGNHAHPICNTNAPITRKGHPSTSKLTQGKIEYQVLPTMTPWHNYVSQHPSNIPTQVVGCPEATTSQAGQSFSHLFAPNAVKTDTSSRYDMQTQTNNFKPETQEPQLQQTVKTQGFRRVLDNPNPPGEMLNHF